MRREVLTRTWVGLATSYCLSAVILTGCGGDDEGGGQQVANQPAQPAAQAKPADAKNKLTPRAHVEDKVLCPVADQPTGPACEPPNGPAASGASSKTVADCDPGLYCLQTGVGFTCEPCPERDSIRHEFGDRDFVAEHARDPFQSYVILQAGVGQRTSSAVKPEPHQSCKRREQFVAINYSYQDLRLVGIVAQDTQRKVLMMDTANLGHIVRRGDCVGKEKAVVKDIGTGYVTFVVEEDADLKRPAQELSVQLHPVNLDTEAGPQSQPSSTTSTTTPIVTPTRDIVPLESVPNAVPTVLPPKK
jgi:Tfp pilus assembly protein PilP